MKSNLKTFLAFTLFLFVFTNYTYSQEDGKKKGIQDQKFKLSGTTSITTNQTSLTNWAAGGQSSLSGKGIINLKGIYKKKNLLITNQMIIEYGLQGFENKKFQKTDDKVELIQSINFKAFNDWNYSALFDFKTQFADGFKYPNDSTVISTFFAPAYLSLSLGFNYQPSEYFSLFISPVSGRLLFVMDQHLADTGMFGVRPAEYDANENKIKDGQNILATLGFKVVTSWKYQLSDNITYDTKVILFNNYTDYKVENRWNIDIDWDSNLTFSINKYLSCLLNWKLLYDHDVKIPIYENVGGKEVEVKKAPRTQFKESLGLGFVYTF